MRTRYNPWPVKMWKLNKLWDEAKKVETNLVSATNAGTVKNYDETLKHNTTLILSTELGYTSIYKRDVND